MSAPPRSATRAGAFSRAWAVWQALAPHAAAIRTIHVSEAGRFGFARLNAAEQGVAALGYVVANRVIGAALWAKLGAAPAFTLRVPAHAEDLVIDAEGVRFTLVGLPRVRARR